MEVKEKNRIIYIRTAIYIFLLFAIIDYVEIFFRFQPSLLWYQNIKIIDKYLSYGSALLLLVLGIFNHKYQISILNKYALSSTKYYFYLISIPIFTYLYIHITLMNIPMLFAIVNGQQLSIEFVIDKPNGYVDSKCYNGIPIREMPFPDGEICGLPKNKHDLVMSKKTIVISGRGTKYGLFARNIETDSGQIQLCLFRKCN